MPAEEEPGVAMAGVENAVGSPQQFCLRWNNHQNNLAVSFNHLLKTKTFVDVTLACDGTQLKAHKIVLSACSPYFQSILMDNPCTHPVIIMRDIKYCDLKAVVDFMYCGEINVSQAQIPALLKVAEMLKVRGLTDVGGEQHQHGQHNSSQVERPLSRSKRPSSQPQENESPKRPRRSSFEILEEGAQSTATRSPSTPATHHSPTPPATLDAVAIPEAGVVGPINDRAPPTPHHSIAIASGTSISRHVQDEIEIRPGIAEMIREEERAKLIENSHAWLGAATSSIADSYQYQLQSMWQKCWNNQIHNMRFRERGPLKSWRPETMAEAIFSVLNEGLSLSQAARKYDIPYPTFVLYANRVHNMLGPSADGAADLRPKGRGRPQRILLGVWPEEHIRAVIRTVVFRDSHAAHHNKEDSVPVFPALTDGTIGVQGSYASVACGNGRDGGVSPNAAAAAAVAAVAHGLRQQMCSMAVAAQRPQEHPPHLAMPPMTMPSPRLPSPHQQSPLPAGLESPLCSPPPPGHALEPPRPGDSFRAFVSPRPETSVTNATGDRDGIDTSDLGPRSLCINSAREESTSMEVEQMHRRHNAI